MKEREKCGRESQKKWFINWMIFPNGLRFNLSNCFWRIIPFVNKTRVFRDSPGVRFEAHIIPGPKRGSGEATFNTADLISKQKSRAIHSNLHAPGEVFSQQRRKCWNVKKKRQPRVFRARRTIKYSQTSPFNFDEWTTMEKKEQKWI